MVWLCAEILNDEDLEDGEIFEDEESANAKNLKANVGQDKTKVQAPPPVAPPVLKKPLDTEKINKSLEPNDKPPREQLVPFLNKGKKRQYDIHEEDTRWKKDGKRNRKSHDLERDGERHAEEDEDMMFIVRGASPSRLEEELEKWDAREATEEMDRGEVSRRPTRSFRGRGGVSRRGERSRGRGRGRGNARVGKRKRLETRDMCQFFLLGRCQRGSDCPYSHDILPPRKAELCKFFMKDCCAKEDKCLYMHSEFPCKYFHTGMKCYANKKCKFNHGALTDTLRNILAKHLDAVPKEIDFARRERDREREDMRERDRREREARDMRGDSRDMRGDPRDMRVDPRDMRGDSRDMRGDSRDVRDVRVDSRDMRIDTRDMRDLRDTRGDVRDSRGDLRDSRVDPRDMRVHVDLRDIRGDARDIRGDHRDIRGDFRDIKSDPRDMRSDHREMRVDLRDLRGGDVREFLRSKSDRDRKIPSLFDIKLNIPDELRSSDGNHTPMPSPTQRSQDSTRSSDRDRDHYSPDRERDRERQKERERELEHERKKREKSERSKERKAKKERAREHRRERKERREKEREKRREHKDKTADKIAESMKIFELMSPTQEVETNITEVPISSDRLYEQDRDTSMFPEHLPKKQRELFLRIQQQQREAENSQASANDDDDEDKIAEENWYSSDEETAPSTALPSILKNLAQTSGTTTTTSSTVSSNSTVIPLLNLLAPVSTASKSTDVNKTPAITPMIPANLDLSNLSSVLEALNNLQKINTTNKTLSQTEVPSNTITSVKPELPPEPTTPEPPKHEPPRVRDPRLRAEGSATDSRRSSIENYSSDVDLRLKSGGKSQQSADVDLRNLPFKPVQHTAACEIEASLASHPPLPWHLAPITVVKADYANLQIQPRPGVNDPRLRWKMRSPTDESGLPRDPRQRLLDDPVRDPRPRQPLLATPDIPPSPIMLGPPPTPRYDEDHRQQLFHMDSDMRQFPPPTPRLEEEVYIPGPTRPVDPRQRNFGMDDPRRSHFPVRPDDVDLRSLMAHRVPFINFNK